MISHSFRRLLAALASAGSVYFGLSDPGFTQGAAIAERYENWEVRSPDGKKSFFLIGHPSDGSGQLWLQCEPKGSLTVAISMSGRAGRKGSQRSQNVQLQIDDERPREYNFIVFESFVALATETPDLSDDRVTAFLEALRTVRKSLVLVYDRTSHAFDVTGLPVARQRFLQLCGRIQTAPGG